MARSRRTGASPPRRAASTTAAKPAPARPASPPPAKAAAPKAAPPTPPPKAAATPTPVTAKAPAYQKPSSTPTPSKQASAPSTNAPATTTPNAPTPMAAPAAGVPAPASGGGSMLGNFAANVASTATGVVVGRAIDRTFFGGGNHAPAEEQSAAPSENYTPAQSMMDSQNTATESIGGACSFELDNFRQCLKDNNNDTVACQFNYDMLTECQKNASANSQWTQ
uniref:CHCH domain-containing protein n=1 Tax=Timspurckia oligopyrenoides TaxID=708627 RepID=A0A7S1ERF7_9RHOD|mmetsp:Transcript_2617/g.4607  ORF Transcript_2617/g.4607 Transcript_2617/m.4607 type:complete len:223 (+) Transcript_2617:221-889(+)|eukprot:CAMPEP_0182442514 /NCGR_PEP_ID=MMETSP1172-20130603/1427_1 /TAXON_ID=708627 /ORGANISM="Timspurckia oligopyrenoides, Strain CCMP3278" /LENGTH=222 /DNA_ID=CAMNT_0024637415 /DNA_START=56 /DNA_END=724 /DNA_ORIENTATION=+